MFGSLRVSAFNVYLAEFRLGSSCLGGTLAFERLQVEESEYMTLQASRVISCVLSLS